MKTTTVSGGIEMFRHAIGIIQHPTTLKWQPFIYTEDGQTVTLACTSKHSSKALAHLFATIILDASKTGKKVNIADMIRTSNESDLPDPLPQVTVDALIADIMIATQRSAATNTILGFW